MLLIALGLLKFSILYRLANGQANCIPVYGACGGIGQNVPTGATCCAGSICQFSNAYYSQCVVQITPSPPSKAVTFAPTARIAKINALTTCLGPSLSSQLYSPLKTGSGYISYNWLGYGSNKRTPKSPLAIILLPSISDVSKTIQCASSSGIQPVVRSGGHSSESPVGSGNYQAKFQSGMKLGQVFQALYSAGEFTMVGGICPYVGSGGHLTGGGQGILTRTYGLGIDQVTGVDIVLADGREVSTSANSNSDLFWALRGGGGASFGVVTHFTVNIFRIPTVSMFMFKFNCAAEVLHFWQTFFLTAPNELESQFKISSTDTWINGQYLGPMENLKALITASGMYAMKSLTSTIFQTCSGLGGRAFLVGGFSCQPNDLNLLNTKPIEENPKESAKSKTDNLNALMPTEVLNQLITMFTSEPNSVLYSHMLGGTGLFTTQPVSATPYADRSAWYTVEYQFSSNTQNHYYPGSTSYTWINKFSQIIKPYTTGYKYLNYQDFDLPQNYGELYWGKDNFKRLVEVKNKYDPTNFFNHPQSVPLCIDPVSLYPIECGSKNSTAPTFASTVAPTIIKSQVPTAEITTKPSLSPSTTTKPSSLRPSTAPISASCIPKYGTCGGIGQKVAAGATCCARSVCKFSNAWYSQCL